MKILIIDENGVKEFIPTNQKVDEKLNSKSTLEILKENFFPTEKIIPKKEISLYTIAKLVALFDTTRPTIYSWIEKGLLKPIKLGGRVYFNQKDIQALLESNTEN